MVWGMRLSNGFGEFWPDGALEGEAKTGAEGLSYRLNLFYREQKIDEQKRLYAGGTAGGHTASYAYYVFQKFIRELGKPGDIDPTPLSPVERMKGPSFTRQ